MQRVDVLERGYRPDLQAMRAVRISPATNGPGIEGNEEGSDDISGVNLCSTGNGLPRLSGPWATWAGLRDTFGFTHRWEEYQLQEAHKLMGYWQSNPIDQDLFTRVYFSLEYTLRYWSITNHARLCDAWQLRIDVAEMALQVFGTRWATLKELAHIPTRTYPDRLASVQDGWRITRNLPIYLHLDGGILALVNGNHRLTTARQYGAESIFVTIAPECPDWTRARQHEEGKMEALAGKG